MTSNQVGKSLLLLSILGYHIVEAPRSCVLVMPTLFIRDRFMKEKFEPLVNSSPSINQAIHRTERGAIPSGIIEYDRGEIHTAHAGSSTALESVTSQLILADEVDGYQFSINGEHPIDALHARKTMFGSQGKLVVASTPTRDDGSIIANEFNKGSGSRWYVPCFKCDDEHPIEWEHVHKRRLYCPSCGVEVSDRDRIAAIEIGKWVDEESNDRHKSYHLSQLYSHIVPIRQTAGQLENGDMTLRGFRKRVLGIPFKPQVLDPLTEDDLAPLYHDVYDGRVSAVTIAVDVQKDRLEYQVVHWTRQFPRVEVHAKIGRTPGDTVGIWRGLARTLAAHDPDMVFVDVGSFTEEVRRAAQRPLRRWAIRSKLRLVRGSTRPDYEGDQSGDLILKQSNKAHPYDLWLGTNTAKEYVHELLANDGISINPKGVPDDFSEQILSEELRRVIRRNGTEGLRWVKKAGVRNEALDCLVYNICARNHLGPAFDRDARRRAVRAMVRNT